MKKFLFIFMFIMPFLYAQSTNYFWNDINIALKELLNKMGVPYDIQYQENSGSYWIAYEFGDAAVIYIINKNVVLSVVYIKNNKNYDDIHNKFIEFNNIAKSDGFYLTELDDSHFKLHKNNIEITGNISIVNTEFVLTILTKNIK